MKRFQGKLFGAALGFSFGGPIGAIIGAAAGHLFDTSFPEKHIRYSKTAEKELTFITSLVLLLTGTARSDGMISPQEVAVIKDFFKHQVGYGPAEYMLIARIIDESLQKETDLREVCAAINERTTYEERLFLIRLNYQVAVSDAALSPHEENFIRQAAACLGIHDYDFTMIRNSFNFSGDNSFGQGYSSGRGGYGRASSGGAWGTRQTNINPNPYAVLGLRPGCSDENVKDAYRDLASKYHPDKVSHLGQEFIDLARERFTQIGNAYEIIKKERGLS
jgi:DnaJ like chaperone protein